jgi:hypothetical protein
LQVNEHNGKPIFLNHLSIHHNQHWHSPMCSMLHNVVSLMWCVCYIEFTHDWCVTWSMLSSHLCEQCCLKSTQTFWRTKMSNNEDTDVIHEHTLGDTSLFLTKIKNHLKHHPATHIRFCPC